MSGSTTPEVGDILGMSDEDILNMSAPPEAGVVDTPAEDEAEQTKADEQLEKVVDPTEDDTSAEATETEDNPETSEEDQEKEAEPKGEGEEQETADTDPKAADADAGDVKDGKKAELEPKEPVSKDADKKADPSLGSTTLKAPSNEEAQAFFMKIMAPFKANGKMIELKTPEEAIQLMQMGANYTRKLQDIQPHRKMLLMLQNNDLLDEGKLSYLIDLDKKNPEAIKKLIKDAGIDPLDIDVSTEPAYLEGSHKVSDKEAGFRTVLEDLISDPAGKETVQLINTHWDEASKEALWENPEIMSIIHSQRENGVFDLINAEVDRQRMLGKIPANTPFLQAYKIVGDELAEANAFNNLGVEQPGGKTQDTQTTKSEPEVVATRTAAPKSKVENEDKASAASPSRSTPRAAEKLVNVLAMSDEEFLSQMNGRL